MMLMFPITLYPQCLLAAFAAPLQSPGEGPRLTLSGSSSCHTSHS